MDADRFDTLAKRLIAPTTRRATLGALTAGGLLSALGLGRAVPETRAAQGGTCLMAFVATVRLGPSANQALTPTGRAPGELRGELSFGLSATGNLQDGVLSLPDGSRFPVVGQATGHSLQVRIELGSRVALVAVGVGEKEIATCLGAIDGVATGPEIGDLGDWHAAVVQQARGGRQSGSGDSTRGNSEETGRGSQSGGVGAPGEACSRRQTRCGNNCVDTASDPDHCGACDAACADGVGCEGGRCACDGGLTLCNGLCIDTATDPIHCGRCLNACADGMECHNGVCDRAVCPPGQTYCGGVDGCRDLSSDLSHCGRCQLQCAGGICLDGVCGPAGSMCPEGQADCGEGCTDLSSNDFHCGACGNECDDGQICLGGACTAGSTCTGGLTNCGGVCVDLSSDGLHCGACDNACAADDGCQGGDCVGAQPFCAAGLNRCNSVCVDVSSDPANCGDCFIACATGQVCQGGVCTGGSPQCTDGLTDCGGVCVNLTNDALNCGVCGLECAYGELCGGQACQNLCSPGNSYCNGACINTTDDINNCGGCGTAYACAANQVCMSGGCVDLVTQPPNFELTCADSGLADCGGVCVNLLHDNNNCGACGHACYPGLCNNGNGTCTTCDPNNPPIAEGFCA